MSHYTNACPEEETVKMSNKKGWNLLVYKNYEFESSSDKENHDCDAGNTQGNLHAITEGNTEEEKYEEND